MSDWHPIATAPRTRNPWRSEGAVIDPDRLIALAERAEELNAIQKRRDGIDRELSLGERYRQSNYGIIEPNAEWKEFLNHAAEDIKFLLAALRAAQQERDHSSCHDLVCNTDTKSQPRGAKGSGCSCVGRQQRAEAEVLALRQERDTLTKQLTALRGAASPVTTHADTPADEWRDCAAAKQSDLIKHAVKLAGSWNTPVEGASLMLALAARLQTLQQEGQRYFNDWCKEENRAEALEAKLEAAEAARDALAVALKELPRWDVEIGTTVFDEGVGEEPCLAISREADGKYVGSGSV